MSELTPEALEALQGSIAKWEAIVAGTGEDLGHHNCPLCKIYWADCCRGCPVRASAGQPSCEGTPYMEWQNVIGEREGWGKEAKWMVTDDASRKLAQAELDFLKSLLPGHDHG